MPSLGRPLATMVRWIARQEGIVLFSALVVVGALVIFVNIVDEMLEGETQDFDEWLLRRLRRPADPDVPIGPRWLIETAQDISALGGPTVLSIVLIAAMAHLALQRNFGAVWLVALTAGTGGVLSTMMKELLARGRPDVVPHLETVASPSFPSGHSMLAAVVYLTLGSLLARFTAPRRLRVYFLSLALLITFLVGSSRVYLGVHYPTDVLGGWSAGLAWALLCWLVARYLQERGRVKRPGQAASSP
jgi:undecaprenyl-diphosphatase